MGRHVLLIEDEPHIAEAIRYILTRDGWAVTSLDEGGAALAAIRREVPDIVVLDVKLPGRSGYEILDDMRADPALSGLPVLVLSANLPREVPAALPGRGGLSRFLAKPFANADVLAAVRQMAGA
ncbi:MAG: response regulator [Rhodobacteraceae bacterium]|nr:response regulator [Paracoccaceae bacterium]